jgi:hypothetical protein
VRRGSIATIALLIVACSGGGGHVDAFCTDIQSMNRAVTQPAVSSSGDAAVGVALAASYKRGLPYLQRAAAVAPSSIRSTLADELTIMRKVSGWDVSSDAGQTALTKYLATEAAGSGGPNQRLAAFLTQHCPTKTTTTR